MIRVLVGGGVGREDWRPSARGTRLKIVRPGIPPVVRFQQRAAIPTQTERGGEKYVQISGRRRDGMSALARWTAMHCGPTAPGTTGPALMASALQAHVDHIR